MIGGGVAAAGGVALLLVMIRRIRGGRTDTDGVDEEDRWPPFQAGSPQLLAGNGPGLSPGGYRPAGSGLADAAELPRLGTEGPAAGDDEDPTQILPVTPA